MASACAQEHCPPLQPHNSSSVTAQLPALTAVRIRQVYDSGAVVRLPFLTLSQLPPAALLNDPRLDYVPPGQSLPEVGRH